MCWASIPPMRTEDGRIKGPSELGSQTCPNLAMHVNDHFSQSSIRLVDALESNSAPVQDMFFGLLDSDDSDSISMQACRVLVIMHFRRQSFWRRQPVWKMKQTGKSKCILGFAMPGVPRWLHPTERLCAEHGCARSFGRCLAQFQYIQSTQHQYNSNTRL